MSYNFPQAHNQNTDPFAHLENPNANPELNERFEENRQEFQEKYAEKLQDILWPENSELYGRIVGSFEQSWDITAAVEINIDNIKNLEDSQRVKSVLLSFLQQNWNTQEIIQEDNIPKNLESDYYNPNLLTAETIKARQKKIDFQEWLWNNAQYKLAKDLWKKTDELDEKLNTTKEQEKNKKQMISMIYNESFLESFMWETKQEIEQNKTLLEFPEVQDDLGLVLSKCVLPVEASSIQEVYQKAWDGWVKQIDRSLNYAFEMRISEILEWKMNFPQETINNLCENIYSGNPVEKIVNFEKIKTIISTNEWMGWAKQSKEYRAHKKLDWAKQIALQEQFEDVRKLLKQANQTTLDQLELKKSQIEDILAMEQAEEAGWNVFSWDLDIEAINDILWENTQKEQTA